MPVLLQFIDKKSTIVTDFTKVYQTCKKYGFQAHKLVCHKCYFVCPNDLHQQRNNVRWRKQDVRICGADSIDRYLVESEYRHRYFNE